MPVCMQSDLSSMQDDKQCYMPCRTPMQCECEKVRDEICNAVLRSAQCELLVACSARCMMVARSAWTGSTMSHCLASRHTTTWHRIVGGTDTYLTRFSSLALHCQTFHAIALHLHPSSSHVHMTCIAASRLASGVKFASCHLHT